MQIREYLRQDGSSPFAQWFAKLDSQAAAKVTTALYRLGAGNTSSVKWFSGLGEHRIDWGPGYRIYLLQEGSEWILLLGGGTKRTQSADIERARLLAREYRNRKKMERGFHGTHT